MHARRRADGPARSRPARRISAPRAEHGTYLTDAWYGLLEYGLLAKRPSAKYPNAPRGGAT
eukprot:7337013-Prymnesium_polylepis.1